MASFRGLGSAGRFLAALLVVVLGGLPALGQPVISPDVAISEVTGEGRLFIDHESQFRTWKPGRYLTHNEWAAYGIGHNTEINAMLINISNPPSGNIVLGVGLKTSLPLLEKQLPERELKWTLGQMVPVSLEGQGVGSWTYTHVSGRLPRLNTRLIAGITAGTEVIFGRDAVAFMAGVEQPLTERITLQAEWFSGTHNMAQLMSGVVFDLGNETMLTLGYLIPNNDHPQSGMQGFVIELGKLF